MHDSQETPADSSIRLSLLERVDQASDRFEDAWEAGALPTIEAFLAEAPEPERPLLLRELLSLELHYRRRAGETPNPTEYLSRFPEHAAVIHQVFAETPAQVPHPDRSGAASRATPPEADRPPEAGSRVTRRQTAAPEMKDAAVVDWPVVPGYEILGELGRGGMGVVYRARHLGLERVVALKMIRAGTQAVPEELARFHTEAALQARVHHPNIVQIFEVGEVAGCPYFALECVDGASLDKRIAGQPQPARTAAELVETLARAVQHAHERGLVHRDLKPANILLTADGTPKVGDFGLAKRLEGDAGQTQSGAVVGTPSYMAPEQAWGRLPAIGPATDVYALGTILYELLTGRPPFLGATTLDTVLQVRHQEPVPPRRLLASVPRDLDTICLKCLHKEPARRYATAADLAADLRRYRAGEPILARPVGMVERGVKWAWRRPTAAALTGLLMAVLVGGAVGALWYAGRERGRANQESALRRQAEQAEEQQRAVLAFFQDQVLAAARPESQEGGLGINATIRNAVDAAEPKIAGAFHDRPLVEASIRHTLGLTYSYLRQDKAAIDQCQRALTMRREQLGPDHPDTLASMNNLAEAYCRAGQPDKAVPLFEQALAKRQETLGPDHADTLQSMNNLAAAYRDTGQRDKALPLFEQALAKRQETLGPDHPDTLASMCSLAAAYWDARQMDKAVPLLEQALAKQKEKLGPGHVDTLVTMNNLAMVYRDAGQQDKAVPLLEQALAKQKEKLGPDHPDTLLSMNNLASAYQAVGQLDKALTLSEQALAKHKQRLGTDHVQTLQSMSNLARVYQAVGQLDKAVPLMEQALAKQKERLGPDHPDTLQSLSILAEAYRDAGLLPKALRLLEETLARRKEKLGPDHPDTLISMNNLAGAYQAVGQLPKALPLFEQTLAKQKETLGPNHPHTLITMNNLALIYQDVGQLDKAVPLLEQTLARRQEMLGPDHRQTLISMNNLARAYQAVGQLDKAVPLFEQTLAKRKATLDPDHPDTLLSMNNLATAYRDAGLLPKALPLLEETLAKWKEKLGPDHLNTLTCVHNLASVYQAGGQFDKALPLFKRALTGFQAKLGPDHPSTLTIMNSLGRAYRDADQLDKAVSLLELTLAKRQETLGPDHPDTLQSMDTLASAYQKNGDFANAERLLRQCLTLRQEKQPDAWTTFYTQSQLGGSLLSQKKYAEAEPLLRAAYEGMKQREATIPANAKKLLTEALEGLVQLYDAWDKPEQAATWRQQAEAAKPPARKVPP